MDIRILLYLLSVDIPNLSQIGSSDLDISVDMETGQEGH